VQRGGRAQDAARRLTGQGDVFGFVGALGGRRDQGDLQEGREEKTCAMEIISFEPRQLLASIGPPTHPSTYLVSVRVLGSQRPVGTLGQGHGPAEARKRTNAARSRAA
jgi:hypothetical protein